MTENQIFRQFVCGLSIEESARLCFKTVNTIKRWDKGQRIPHESRRLMKLYSYRELATSDEWKEFYMQKNILVLPNGIRMTPAQVLLASALLEIGSEPDIEVVANVVRTARSLAKLMNRK
ncbi:hypothetical protein VSF3289_03885 [Vibrio scophthalmi]|uniref:Uncharacterized protein n=2 Tax=Vibrio scophthalmi TaxID=45658 RepID=A0A1E3WG40_9VIBR|nr:hypothetical protein VSF3289_03885 [Vibrio scophthalmi]